jgi:Holliday junction resolvase RusA-like endonuclease
MTTTPARVRIGSIYEGMGSDAPAVFRAAYLSDDTEVIAHLVVDGEPVSKSRVQWNKKRAFSPDKTVQAELSIGWAFRRARPGHVLSKTSGFGVVAIFFCGTGQRRDVDNMMKVVLDGLNHVAWPDDSQVTEITGRKTRCPADQARVEIIIYPTRSIPAHATRPCLNCNTPYPYYPSHATSRRFCNAQCGREYRKKENTRTCKKCGGDFTSKPTSPAMFCSRACHESTKNVTQPCVQCGEAVTRQQCKAERSRAFCSDDCRIGFFRASRRAAAKGTCTVCGGPTTKKTYVRCQLCKIAKRYPEPKEAT